MEQVTNDIKSLFGNDGNVILLNIHIGTPGSNQVVLPAEKSEMGSNRYAQELFSFSSLLPLRYNTEIARYKNVSDMDQRYRGVAMNADMSILTKLMDIGTPTNINANI